MDDEGDGESVNGRGQGGGGGEDEGGGAEGAATLVLAKEAESFLVRLAAISLTSTCWNKASSLVASRPRTNCTTWT
jgi:hypothetical protein